MATKQLSTVTKS